MLGDGAAPALSDQQFPAQIHLARAFGSKPAIGLFVGEHACASIDVELSALWSACKADLLALGPALSGADRGRIDDDEQHHAADLKQRAKRVIAEPALGVRRQQLAQMPAREVAHDFDVARSGAEPGQALAQRRNELRIGAALSKNLVAHGRRARVTAGLRRCA